MEKESAKTQPAKNTSQQPNLTNLMRLWKAAAAHKRKREQGQENNIKPIEKADPQQ